MVTEDQVQFYRDQYKFKIRLFDEWTLLVDSGLDEWLIIVKPKVSEDHRNVILQHKNSKRDRGHYHLQGKFTTLYLAFVAIHSHENRFFCTEKRRIKLNSLYKKIYT